MRNIIIIGILLISGMVTAQVRPSMDCTLLNTSTNFGIPLPKGSKITVTETGYIYEALDTLAADDNIADAVLASDVRRIDSKWEEETTYAGIYNTDADYVTIGEIPVGSAYKFNVQGGATKYGIYADMDSESSTQSLLRLNSGTSNKFNLYGNGKAKFHEYGAGNVSGTPTYIASFDADGDLIESAIPVTETIQIWDGTSTVDWEDGNVITYTMVADKTMNVHNIAEGKTSQIRIKHSSTSVEVLTLNLYSGAGGTALTKITFGVNTGIATGTDDYTKIIFQRFGTDVDISYIYEN